LLFFGLLRSRASCLVICSAWVRLGFWLPGHPVAAFLLRVFFPSSRCCLFEDLLSVDRTLKPGRSIKQEILMPTP
jgi:hypothetical protein